jgi:hypothetical protein
MTTSSLTKERKMSLLNGGARRLMAIGVLSLAALAFGSTAAAAAGKAAGTGPAKFTVDAGQLVLSHDGARYTGTMRVTVRNTGGEAASSTSLRIALPAGLKYEGGAGVCLLGSAEVRCDSFETVEPGARATFTLSFGSWAAPAARARVTASATLTAAPGGAGSAGAASDTYAGILKSTTGSIRNPRPYTPSTVARTQVTAGPAAVQEVPSTTGLREFQVRIPVTVRAGNDIPNDLGMVRTITPAGSGFVGTDPSTVCASTCEVPGGWLGAGEVRTFALVFTYSTATVPVNETVTVEVTMNHAGVTQPEAAPAANTATVPLVIAA